MLSHYIAPSSFGMSTMILIPKGNGLMGDIKNYRGIALSSLLSKLFDTCIISSQFDRLQSNDLQFAYKPQTSTILLPKLLAVILIILNRYVCVS